MNFLPQHRGILYIVALFVLSLLHMLTSEFSINSLRRLTRWSDKISYNVLKADHLRNHYLSNLQKRIESNTFEFDKFRQIRIGSFSAFQPMQLGDTLVIRKLNSVLRNLYTIKQSDRHAIIFQIKVILEENAPKYIYKLDIAKFFETVDRNFLLRKITTDNLMSPACVSLLTLLMSHFGSHAKRGLPRGLAISSTLAELYLRPLDRAVPQIDGVYYYARYVDDILIFSSKPLKDIKDTVEQLLPGRMKLNAEKCHSYYVGCLCSPSCGCSTPLCKCSAKCKCSPDPSHEINYLGYKFVCSRTRPGNDKHTSTVTVAMADNKISRLKSRVVFALRDHVKQNDSELLYRRIRFLSENHRIKRNGGRGKLMSGLHFNYPLISDAQFFKPIDHFLRAQIFASNGTYGGRISASLTQAEKERLAKLSFVSGFKNQRSRVIAPSVLSSIRKCWR